MIIHLIWAQEKDGGIGINNSLPWHISEDLKNFKKITLNKPIIMGRKTWDSLPFKPLPHRRNIVLSSLSMNEVECYTNLENCLESFNVNDSSITDNGIGKKVSIPVVFSFIIVICR